MKSDPLQTQIVDIAEVSASDGRGCRLGIDGSAKQIDCLPNARTAGQDVPGCSGLKQCRMGLVATPAVVISASGSEACKRVVTT